MSPIDKLPDWVWSDRASEEIALTGEELIRSSHCAWRLGNVAICGLVYSSFTRPPRGWFALAKDVTLRDLIDFRALERFIPEGTCVAVAADFATGRRFAEFYGFVDTGVSQTHAGAVYNIYRRA